MKNVGRNGNSKSGVIFDIFNYLILGFFSLVAILPFLYIFAASFASDNEIRNRVFFVIPEHASLYAYKYLLSSDTLVRSIFVSIYITLIGTLLNLIFTVTMAYGLAKKDLRGRNFILNCVIVTMVFSGGMIPGYLVVRNLHLIDSFWALWLPGVIGASNLIIVKNFFQDLPAGLQEAARIDGCTELQVLYKIVLPISKPVLATFGLFYAVGHWNDFRGPLFYINDLKKWPLQLIMRQMLMLTQSTNSASVDLSLVENLPQESIKMAIIIVGILPILMIYPFLQKHFAKGVMVGSIKG